METESKLVLLGAGWGMGKWEFLLNGYRVSLWEDGKALEVDGGDSYTIM